MRFMVLAAIVAVSPPPATNILVAPTTRLRDCLTTQEAGMTAPTSNHPDAKWLYISTVMKFTKDGSGAYGADVGWKVAGSLEQACDIAVSDFRKEPKNKGWAITGAIVQLVPDTILREGAMH
jgi:hypothetical protein